MAALHGLEPDSARRSGFTIACLVQGVFLAPGTIRNHLSSAIGETNTTTRAEAVRAAESNGWF